MTLLLSDPRCPQCGAKLCERIELVKGRVAFTCRKCNTKVVFEEGMPKVGKPTE